jgi:hypothetical protein
MCENSVFINKVLVGILSPHIQVTSVLISSQWLRTSRRCKRSDGTFFPDQDEDE